MVSSDVGCLFGNYTAVGPMLKVAATQAIGAHKYMSHVHVWLSCQPSSGPTGIHVAAMDKGQPGDL